MSNEELKEAVKQILEDDTTYLQIKAQIRSLVYNILMNRNNDEIGCKKDERLELANEIVREFLLWSGCYFTKDVFEHETGLETSPAPRTQLLQQIGVYDTGDSAKLPILLGIVESFRKKLLSDD